jgi:hypothetical protein
MSPPLKAGWNVLFNMGRSQQAWKKPETTIRTLTKFTNSQIYQQIYKKSESEIQ